MWTFRARLTVLLAFLFYVIGIINDLSSIYFLTSFVISTGGTCFLLALYSVTGLAFEVELDADQVFEDEPLRVRLRIANRARVRKAAFLLRAQIVNETQRSGVERWFHADGLAAGETTELVAAVTGLRRGAGEIVRLEAIGSDPLGLFRKRLHLPLQAKFTVYPQIWSLPNEPELSGDATAGRKDSRAGIAPAGLEFTSIRPFVDSDDLRHVHWASTARLGRLAVKQFNSTARNSCVVALDLRGARAGDRCESAIRAAATLASSRVVENEEVSMLLLAAETSAVPFGCGSWHRLRLLDALARVQAPSEPPAMTDEIGRLALRFIASVPAHAAIYILSCADAPPSSLMGAMGRHATVRVLLLTENSASPGCYLARDDATAREGLMAMRQQARVRRGVRSILT